MRRSTTPLLFGAMFLATSFLACTTQAPQAESFSWWTFQKIHEANPCLMPGDALFDCPIRGETIAWEAKDVFNPAAVVREGKVYMIYRAEDTVGKYAGTSRLGLAISDDGMTFRKEALPVFFPDNDSLKKYEWEGGVEDPRIVETPEGEYVMTYTAYDGVVARLLVATSPDLRTWTKHGLAFGEGKYRDLWSKSGAILCEQSEERLVARRINGKYWMYFGDKQLHVATSTDLIHWAIKEDSVGKPAAVMSYRKGKFDSDLVEPGPPALFTPQGILLIYNGRNYGPDQDPTIQTGTYSAGQALFALTQPDSLINRMEEPFFWPEADYEIEGQVNRVVFVQGLVPFQGKWFLYYGTADSKIGVAKRD